MKKNKILILLAIIILVYSISDYFFNDSIMYLIGGIIAGGLKLFGSNSNPIVFILTWISILLIAIAIYKMYPLVKTVIN